MPVLGNPAYASVWSNNPLANGLAMASDTPTQPCPNNLAELLEQTTGHGHDLVILDDLLPPVLYEDGPGWRAAAQALDNNWFIPLRTALGGSVDTLRIVAPTIYGQLIWTLQGKDRWKFWRKPRSLPALAKFLAEGTPS